MFTGIIQAVGKIAHSEPRDQDQRIAIQVGALDMSDVQLGDSIAVNGVCLTVVRFDQKSFDVDVSAETLRCTVGFDLNSEVNLEKALRLADRLGGHLVSGHVDGVGEVVRFEPVGDCYVLEITAPDDIARYVATKGSVTVNGVSLTVNQVAGQRFTVNLIPHTLEMTTLKHLKPGSRVNLEVDLLARYAERLLHYTSSPTKN
ncbi:MAG: riboflavin synthase [Burkholderiales bacterium]|nr:riboflavin synthase [Burkholderiales bacterium]